MADVAVGRDGTVLVRTLGPAGDKGELLWWDGDLAAHAKQHKITP